MDKKLPSDRTILQRAYNDHVGRADNLTVTELVLALSARGHDCAVLIEQGRHAFLDAAYAEEVLR